MVAELSIHHFKNGAGMTLFYFINTTKLCFNFKFWEGPRKQSAVRTDLIKWITRLGLIFVNSELTSERVSAIILKLYTGKYV